MHTFSRSDYVTANVETDEIPRVVNRTLQRFSSTVVDDPYDYALGNQDPLTVIWIVPVSQNVLSASKFVTPSQSLTKVARQVGNLTFLADSPLPL